ncbi:MAG: XVIPCD domain-containing protein [Pseudomonadota bacterium]
MTNPTPLTPSELRALAYFAVGVTSEGSLGGRDLSYRLSFAGSVGRDGRMAPVGNSGYSFGTLQIDLGQHPDVARGLLDAYQLWAARQPDRAALVLPPDAYAGTLQALQRTGREMRAAGAHDIDRSRLNRFLASDDGRTFVHGLDREHVEGVAHVDAVQGNRDSALERLQRTPLYRNGSDEDQAALAALFMKLQNQSGQRYVPRLLTGIEQGTLASPDAVKAAIDGLLPNAANGNVDYIQSGADNTLRGVGVFNALRAADRGNPLARAWAAVAADPLIGPVAAHANDRNDPTLGLQYDTVRSLFLTPEASQRMIRALDRDAALAEGDPALRQGRRSPGFYVSGNDFVHWNASGQGVACIHGRWRSVDPDALRRVARRDGTVELQITENGVASTLLRVDPRARSLGAAGIDPPTAPTRPAASETRPQRRNLLADDPAHPGFETFHRIHAWVRDTGHWNDEQSRNVAAALYRAQAADPLVRRVDLVAGGRGHDGAENVFAVYMPHGDKGPSFVTQVDGRHAAHEPAEQSLAQAESPNNELVQDARQRGLPVAPRMTV